MATSFAEIRLRKLRIERLRLVGAEQAKAMCIAPDYPRVFEVGGDVAGLYLAVCTKRSLWWASTDHSGYCLPTQLFRTPKSVATGSNEPLRLLCTSEAMMVPHYQGIANKASVAKVLVEALHPGVLLRVLVQLPSNPFEREGRAVPQRVLYPLLYPYLLRSPAARHLSYSHTIQSRWMRPECSTRS